MKIKAEKCDVIFQFLGGFSLLISQPITEVLIVVRCSICYKTLQTIIKDLDNQEAVHLN